MLPLRLLLEPGPFSDLQPNSPIESEESWHGSVLRDAFQLARHWVEPPHPAGSGEVVLARSSSGMTPLDPAGSLVPSPGERWVQLRFSAVGPLLAASLERGALQALGGTGQVGRPETGPPAERAMGAVWALDDRALLVCSAAGKGRSGEDFAAEYPLRSGGHRAVGLPPPIAVGG